MATSRASAAVRARVAARAGPRRRATGAATTSGRSQCDRHPTDAAAPTPLRAATRRTSRPSTSTSLGRPTGGRGGRRGPARSRVPAAPQRAEDEGDPGGQHVDAGCVREPRDDAADGGDGEEGPRRGGDLVDGRVGDRVAVAAEQQRRLARRVGDLDDAVGDVGAVRRHGDDVADLEVAASAVPGEREAARRDRRRHRSREEDQRPDAQHGRHDVASRQSEPTTAPVVRTADLTAGAYHATRSRGLRIRTRSR